MHSCNYCSDVRLPQSARVSGCEQRRKELAADRPQSEICSPAVPFGKAMQGCGRSR